MKITIEWSGTLYATVSIDGKEFRYSLTRSGHEILGLNEVELEETIGGRIASALFDVVPDLQQAEAAAMQVDDPNGLPAWKRLSEEAIEAFGERVS